jgi:hypothetical protein
VFLRGPCRGVQEDNWVDQVQFFTVVYESRIAREAEESPLLETDARERLVKRHYVGKGLAGAVVISGGAVIACSSESNV